MSERVKCIETAVTFLQDLVSFSVPMGGNDRINLAFCQTKGS